MPNLFRSARASQLLCEVRLDVTFTSLYKSPVASPVNRPTVSNSTFLSFTTPTCMDPSRNGQDACSRQMRPRQSISSLRPPTFDIGPRSQPHSNPLPQTEWSDIPLPYRPREWIDHENQRLELSSNTSQDWRLRPAIPGRALSGSSTSTPLPLRARRRVQGPRDLSAQPAHADNEQALDYSLLYPQMSPYDGQYSSRSAPDELQHPPRCVSQPTTPNYFQQQIEQDEPQPGLLPRSPTYPPTGRRRMHSDTGVQDAAFADEEEFRLFVAATAGLGPEQVFRNSRAHPSSSASLDRRSWNDDGSNSRVAPSDDLVSPLEETPTTLRALQHFAQMPQAPGEPRRRPTLRALEQLAQMPQSLREPQRRSTVRALQQLAQMPQASDEPQRQRLQSSASGLDLWLQPPGNGPSSGTSLTDMEDDIPSDEEPPDYASSQAQAQAAQRVVAARRAEELQRRWQARSGGRNA